MTYSYVSEETVGPSFCLIESNAISPDFKFSDIFGKDCMISLIHLKIYIVQILIWFSQIISASRCYFSVYPKSCIAQCKTNWIALWMTAYIIICYGLKKDWSWQTLKHIRMLKIRNELWVSQWTVWLSSRNVRYYEGLEVYNDIVRI